MNTSLGRRVTAMLAASALTMVAVGGGAVAATAQTRTAPSASTTALHGLSKIAIVFNRWDPASTSAQLRVGDPLGLGSRPLTTPPSGSFDTHPLRSPNGREILFMRESEAGVAIGILTIAHPSSLRWIDTGCAAVPDCVADVGPTWSADGARVIFTRVVGPFDEETGDAAGAALYSTKLDGTDLRPVGDPPETGAENTGAQYTADGKHIVFIRDQRVDGVLKFAIFRMRADGTQEQQLTPWELNADRPEPSPARVGPTAGMMTFETYGGAEPARGDIAMVPYMCPTLEACTASIRYVTHNGGGPKSSYSATWSPDGMFLAYAEEPDATGKVDVWTSRWDGTLRHQLTRDQHSYSPAWS